MSEERAEREGGSLWSLKGHSHLGSSRKSREKRGSKGGSSRKQRGGRRGERIGV